MESAIGVQYSNKDTPRHLEVRHQISAVSQSSIHLSPAVTLGLYAAATARQRNDQKPKRPSSMTERSTPS